MADTNKSEKDKQEEQKKERERTKSERDSTPLSADPEVAYFKSTGGKSEHMLVNVSDKRLAIKIRCSNNEMYRVHPVNTIIDAGQAQSLMVTRLAGAGNRTDKLIIQYVSAEVGDVNVKELFKKVEGKGTKPETLRILLKMEGQEGNKKVSYERLEE